MDPHSPNKLTDTSFFFLIRLLNFSFFCFFHIILLLLIFTKIMLLLLCNLFLMKIIFIFSFSGMFRHVPECSVFRVLSTCVTHSVTPPCFMPNKMKAISECVKNFIPINFYFLLKIWQMRNVSAQNLEKILFPFLFHFQSNNHAIFYNAIYVPAKCGARWRMCQPS